MPYFHFISISSGGFPSALVVVLPGFPLLVYFPHLDLPLHRNGYGSSLYILSLVLRFGPRIFFFGRVWWLREVYFSLDVAWYRFFRSRK